MGLFRRRRQHPEQETLIQDCPFVVLDTELTGLDARRDSIVSIGAVRMQGFTIDLSRIFDRLVKPETNLRHDSILIHGITPAEVNDQPRIQTVLSDFSAFCGQDILVGYCIPIDMAFISRQLKQSSGAVLKNPVVDIYRLYEWIRNRSERKGDTNVKFPVLGESGLYEIARFFSIPFGSAHNAIMDAFITAQIFQRILCKISDEGIHKVSELLRIGDPYKGDDVFGRSGEKISFQF